MTPPTLRTFLPETDAAERLRQHLQQIASERDRAHRALQEREAELARIQRIAASAASKSISATASRTAARRNISSFTACRPRRPTKPMRNGSSRIHPEDRERTVKHLFDVLRGESEDYIAEYRIVRPNDGEIRWIRVVAKIERDRDGRALRLVGADLDVTDQMLAQETLRESEERFRLIADSAPVPIWVTKLDRTRSFANQAYVDFLGLPFEEAIAFDWRKRASSGRPAAHRAGIDRRRSLAEAVRAGSALPARRRRMALAAVGIPAALGPERQPHRLHRRRPRHHRRQAGRAAICAG